MVAALAAPLAGCKQGVGDRCQVQSDCDDGLICVLAAGGTPQTGGTCQPPGGNDGGGDFATTSADLLTPPDLTVPPADLSGSD